MKTKITILSVLLLVTIYFQGQAQWSLTGNSNATTSSILGTTNSIPLRLFTKNTARMVIDTFGRVGVGTTTPINLLTVKGAGSTPATSWVSAGAPLFVGFGETAVGNADFILGMGAAAANARPVFVGRKSRGTLATPAAVVANDFLMSFLASGYDGSSFQNPAAIDFYADGASSAGNVPARISFVTGTSSSNRAERLKIGSTGDISVNNTQFTIAQSTGNVSIGAGNLLVAKKANFKGIVGVNGDTLLGTALMVNANAANDGIRITDPVNKYVLYATKSGTGQGIYVTKSSTSSTNGSITGVGTKASIGVEGYGSTGNGVFAQSDSTQGLYAVSNTSIGVYAQTNNALSYAGYFNGDVHTTGTFTSSDARFKNNISDFGNAMQIIHALQPKHYTFKKEGDYALLQLPQGIHYGLLAQDVEKVLPNLVKETQVAIKDKRPADGLGNDDPTNVHNLSFKAVNYTELIPVIIKGIQEMAAENEQVKMNNKQLKADIEGLKAEMEEVKALIKSGHDFSKQSVELNSSAGLSQNIPNPPVGNATTIQYRVPKEAIKAQMLVADMNGKLLKQINLNNGKGSVNLNTQGLSVGTYSYTLLVDGKVIETRRMIIQ